MSERKDMGSIRFGSVDFFDFFIFFPFGERTIEMGAAEGLPVSYFSCTWIDPLPSEAHAGVVLDA